jgi:PiT family inorganic phosphate transporter
MIFEKVKWRRPPLTSQITDSTLRNIALAWVLTLPAAMMLSGTLYFVFSHVF